MNFHETKTARIFFERQLPQLIDAIRELTAVLSRTAPSTPLPAAADPDFLRDLYFGRYEPEVFSYALENHALNRTVIDTHTALLRCLPKEARQHLEAYESAVSSRNALVTEQAYESGFRTAVQMMMAGLSRPAGKTAEGEENRGE